jgi:hypothetical protein
LKVAYYIVEPRLGTIEKPVPSGGEEKKGKTGPDGRPRQHFRQLSLLVHTNLLYDRRGTSAHANPRVLDDPPSLNQLYEQCDDCQHEQYVDKTTERVRAHDTKHP